MRQMLHPLVRLQKDAVFGVSSAGKEWQASEVGQSQCKAMAATMLRKGVLTLVIAISGGRADEDHQVCQAHHQGLAR